MLEVWFEFASTYSYPGIFRVGPEAAARGVAVVWKPFLLGPVFRAQGWNDSPFNIYPAKGRYMWRDTVVAILDALGRPGREIVEGAQTAEVKERLRRQTDEAIALGIFGAPTWVVDGELF